MTKNIYEGMFLMDAGNPDFQAASEPVRALLERREAEILACKPWDERRLSYEIKGRKRGFYILSYFKLDPEMVSEIEHDIKLDERVLRALILRKDKFSEELLHAETPAEAGSRGGQAREDSGSESSGGDSAQPAAKPAPRAAATEASESKSESEPEKKPAPSEEPKAPAEGEATG